MWKGALQGGTDTVSFACGLPRYPCLVLVGRQRLNNSKKKRIALACGSKRNKQVINGIFLKKNSKGHSLHSACGRLEHSCVHHERCRAGELSASLRLLLAVQGTAPGVFLALRYFGSAYHPYYPINSLILRTLSSFFLFRPLTVNWLPPAKFLFLSTVYSPEAQETYE